MNLGFLGGWMPDGRGREREWTSPGVELGQNGDVCGERELRMKGNETVGAVRLSELSPRLGVPVLLIDLGRRVMSRLRLRPRLRWILALLSHQIWL